MHKVPFMIHILPCGKSVKCARITTIGLLTDSLVVVWSMLLYTTKSHVTQKWTNVGARTLDLVEHTLSHHIILSMIFRLIDVANYRRSVTQ